MKTKLDKLQKYAENASGWSKYKRDGDYVDFGPVQSHKDNGEGNEYDYKLVATLNPDTVLELVRLARIGLQHDK